MAKKQHTIEVINAWCSERKIRYSDFQKMETLGYIKVIFNPKKDDEIIIVNKNRFNKFISDIG